MSIKSRLVLLDKTGRQLQSRSYSGQKQENEFRNKWRQMYGKKYSELTVKSIDPPVYKENKPIGSRNRKRDTNDLV